MAHELPVSETAQRVFNALFDEHFLTVRRYAERRLAEVTMAEDIAAENLPAKPEQ